tara:strand:+ start:519 stop:1838 length:1320 start_codon:yes stop_codon:yes gene_type:complete
VPKKRTKKINPIELLSPIILPDHLEEEMRDLYELACQHSKSVWPKLNGFKEERPSQILIDEFMRLTHLGMRMAQEKIVNNMLLLKEEEEFSDARRFAYRGIADAIGWQLFKNELAYVKRYFMAQKPPALHESNIQSVLLAVKQCHEQYPDSIALISDLTSFIQIGDIYHAKRDGRIGIYEVKEGKVNHDILEILENTPALVDNADVPKLFANKTDGFQKQVQRTLRQKHRMNALSDTLKNDEGIDAYSGLPVKIHDLPINVGTWYESLVRVSEECESKGYGLDVIQDCFYIGCYQTGKYKAPGQLAFEVWFSQLGGTSGCPRTSLINCMLDPLGLPIYNLPIPDELKFDLLFGRKHVSLAIHMPRLMEICSDNGISIRLADRKETARLKQKNKYLWRYNGQAIVLGEGKRESCLGEGFALRVFYHGENPIDTMIAFAST